MFVPEEVPDGLLYDPIEHAHNESIRCGHAVAATFTCFENGEEYAVYEYCYGHVFSIRLSHEGVRVRGFLIKDDKTMRIFRETLENAWAWHAIVVMEYEAWLAKKDDIGMDAGTRPSITDQEDT